MLMIWHRQRQWALSAKWMDRWMDGLIPPDWLKRLIQMKHGVPRSVPSMICDVCQQTPSGRQEKQEVVVSPSVIEMCTYDSSWLPIKYMQIYVYIFIN